MAGYERIPERTEYSITATYPNGRKVEFYGCTAYLSFDEAQARADQLSVRWPRKTFEVRARVQPAYDSFTLMFPKVIS